MAGWCANSPVLHSPVSVRLVYVPSNCKNFRRKRVGEASGSAHDFHLRNRLLLKPTNEPSLLLRPANSLPPAFSLHRLLLFCPSTSFHACATTQPPPSECKMNFLALRRTVDLESNRGPIFLNSLSNKICDSKFLFFTVVQRKINFSFDFEENCCNKFIKFFVYFS